MSGNRFSARDSFGALHDRGRGKLTERAAMTTYNVVCVIAFKTILQASKDRSRDAASPVLLDVKHDQV